MNAFFSDNNLFKILAGVLLIIITISFTVIIVVYGINLQTPPPYVLTVIGGVVTFACTAFGVSQGHQNANGVAQQTANTMISGILPAINATQQNTVATQQNTVATEESTHMPKTQGKGGM